MNQQRKLLLIVVGVIVFIGGLLVILSAIQGSRVTVRVSMAPTESKLFVDGKSIRPGKVSLSKGKHTFKATLQYFTDDVKTIDTKTFDTSKTLFMSPHPDSDQAKQWLLSHGDQQAQREAQAAKQAAQQQQELAQNKLLQYLPFVAPGFEFKVDYDAETGADGQVVTTIYVEANSDQAKHDAISWIRSTGVDPNKLTIVYQNYDHVEDNPNIGHQ